MYMKFIQLFLGSLILSGLTVSSYGQTNDNQTVPNLFVVPTDDGDGVWGAVDNDGLLVIDPIYKVIREFPEDPTLPTPVQDQKGKWGYLNRSGDLVHPMNLDTARSFTQEGLARFEKDGLWGFVLPNGDYAIEPIYQYAVYFSNGYAQVKNDKGWNYINVDGETLFEEEFDRLGDFSESGVAYARKKGESHYGYIDTQGNWIIKPKFDRVTGLGKANRAAVELGEKWGVVDKAGKWIVKPVYDRMDSFGENDFAIFYTDWDRGGIIDIDGKITLDHRDERFYEARYNAQCDVVLTDGYDLEFYDVKGNSLEHLEEHRLTLFSGFDERCETLALAGEEKWTRMKVDGSRNDLPQDVQEPYFSSDDEGRTVISMSSGDFMPFIMKDRSLAYFNENNEVTLRGKTERTESGDIFIVSDSKGEELWRYSYSENILVETNKNQFFLTKGNLEFGYETPTKESIKEKIAQLKQKTPSPFEPSYGYDLDDSDGDSFGAGIRLADAWYDYGDHAYRYYYSIDWPNYTPQFIEVKTVIESILGDSDTESSVVEETLESNYIYGDNLAAWLIDGSVLVLHDTYYEDGDVDYWASLNLLLLPTNKTKSSLTSLVVVPASSLTLADKSSADISIAINELKDGVSYHNAEGLRRLAVNVLDIAKTGEEINKDDYLWAQYGQLLATFYEGADELQVGTPEEFTALAINTLDFLDEHGIGEDLLTAEGQTRLEVYRYTTNLAAWELRESDPELALEIIERVLPYIGSEDTYIYDTQVRILINLGRDKEAYKVIKNVLDENPWFDDFNEFTYDVYYEDWLKEQDGKLLEYDDIITTTSSLREKQDITVHSASNQLAVYWVDELRVFDLISGEQNFVANTGTYDPFSVNFNIDGSQLITSGWDKIAVWNTANGETILKQENEDSNSECAGLSAKEGVYYYDSETYNGNILNVSKKSGRSLLRVGFGYNCNTSSDNHFIAVKGDTENGRDQIQVIDLVEHKVVAKLIGNEADSYDDYMFFVQNNKKLLVRASWNFYLWDIASGKVETSWSTGELDVDEVVSDSDYIFVLDGDAWVARLWHFDEEPSGDIALPIPDYANGGASYRGFKVNESQTEYVVSAINEQKNLHYVFLFDFVSHKLIKEFVFTEDFGEVFFANNDQYLVLDGYPITVLDLKTGEIVNKINRLSQ